MNFRKGKSREDPEINLIAFIDVLLVILIFLMVTTTYSKFTELQINLPTADTNKATDQPFELNVAVDAQNHYAINNVQVSYRDAAGLADDMKRIVNEKGDKRDPVVKIHADAAAPHQSVMNIMHAAQIAGFDKITFYSQTSGKQ